MTLSLHRKEKKGIANVACILAALLLSVSCFAALLSQLKLPLRMSNFFAGGLKGGLTAVWNHVADVMGNTSYHILPVYDGAGEGYGLFLLLTFLVMAVAAYFIVRSRLRPLVFLFVLPQFLIALLYPLQPAPAFTVFQIAAVLFALLVMSEPNGLWKALLCAAIPAIVAAVLLLALGADSPVLRGNSSGKTAVGERVADLVYGKDDLGHGDLTKRIRSIRTGKALSVTMSEPQSMYLKGFTGAILNGNTWIDLSDTTYYQAKDLMDALSNDGFYAPGQLAETAAIAYGALPQNEITVKNTGADRRIVYVPYDLSDSGSLEKLDMKGGTEFYPGHLKGIRSYQYTAAENQVDNWTDAAARFYTIALGKEQEGQEAAADLLRQESHFNTFVYDNFTFLTSAERRVLAEHIGSSGDQSKGHMDYKLAINTIRGYLEDNFIYTEDLGAKSSGSALEEFFTSHKGYDIHFATAATLMFRYFGIPARYVEGYLITSEDAAQMSAGEAFSVGRERAHAWCEIYLDGVGFVPLEVTPEFYGVMDEADLRIGLSNEALVQEFQDQYGGEAQEEEEEPAEPNKEGDNILSLIYIVLAIIGGLAVLTGLFFLLRWLIRLLIAGAARRKLFYKSDPKTAVAAIYGYMEEQDLKPGADVIALGNMAAYSRRKISEQDRTGMLKALDELKKQRRKK